MPDCAYVTLVASATFEKQASAPVVLTWKGIEFVRDSPGGMSGQPLLPSVTVAFGLLVVIVPLTPVIGAVPSLRTLTSTLLHSFGSSTALPVITCASPSTGVTTGAPTVITASRCSTAPHVSCNRARTVAFVPTGVAAVVTTVSVPSGAIAIVPPPGNVFGTTVASAKLPSASKPGGLGASVRVVSGAAFSAA